MHPYGRSLLEFLLRWVERRGSRAPKAANRFSEKRNTLRSRGSYVKESLQYKGAGIWWLYIPRSKTDQFKKGETVAFKVVDTYKILWDKFFEQFIQGSGEEFLFSSCPGLPSSTDALRKHMNDIFRSAGLHHKGLTPHSLRGGAATAALRRGVSQDDIKRVGRWKSTSSMLHYIEPTPI
ncbi:site-specific recombinase, phage integrase family [Cooperia oncophora]